VFIQNDILRLIFFISYPSWPLGTRIKENLCNARTVTQQQVSVKNFYCNFHCNGTHAGHMASSSHRKSRQRIYPLSFFISHAMFLPRFFMVCTPSASLFTSPGCLPMPMFQ